MSLAREHILQKLRHSETDKLSSRHPHRSNPASLSNQTNRSKSGAQMNTPSPSDTRPNLELFIEKLEQSRVEVYTASQTNWKEILLELIRKKNIKSLLLGQNKAYQTEVSREISKYAPNTSILCYDIPYEKMKKKLFHEIDASITLATAAIADTGTLLIIPDNNEPRMMSLIPEIHIVLLDQKDLKATFQHLIHHRTWDENNMPTNILFISSPSKTADIQQTLAYGAHGPKELIVIIRTET